MRQERRRGPSSVPSLSAFGHPGAGGSLAFADPENRLSFAYVMNQMEPGVLPNAKALRLIERALLLIRTSPHVSYRNSKLSL
jgi:CubicO group peptidase (beta-lactamase class C family)